MNIETTLTIPTEDVRQQAHLLTMNRDTYESGQVLHQLLDAFMHMHEADKREQELKEQLETERDEAREKLEAAELLLKEAKHLTRMLFHTWGASRDSRNKVYAILSQSGSGKTADEFADAMSDVDGRIDELNYTLNEDK